MRNCWKAAAVVSVLFILCVSCAAEPDVYYNITGVKCEQMQNAVRVTIEADGTIAANIYKWWDDGPDKNYYLDWQLVDKQTSGIWSPDCYPKVDRIRIHLDNARPQIGSVFHVGKYPVSHVEFSMTQDKDISFGLDMDICLHKPMRFRYFKLGEWDTWDAYLIDHHDPAWFEVVQSQDQRSIVITVQSDRLPLVSERRKAEDVPDSERELRIGWDEGFLSVHAKNARLSEVLRSVSQVTGTRILIDPSTERLVTAEIPHITVSDFTSGVSDCYGLTLEEKPDCLVFSDIDGRSLSAYTTGTTERIPVRWLKAGTARDLLPNFLLDLVRVDNETNTLVVSGSKSLAQKIAADLEKIDKPGINVSVRAVLLEYSSSKDLDYASALDYSNNGLELSLDSSTSDITYRKIDLASPAELDAKLHALEASQKIKIRSESNITMLSGEKGEIFAGLDKFIEFRRTPWAQEKVVEPVSAGVSLSVLPWVGNGDITISVFAETRNVGEIDPVSQLPVINTRNANGVMRIKPGDTILIGGLSQEQTYTTVRKIPILGDLPIVGKLFRKRVKQQVKSELAFLLTPGLIVDGGKERVEKAGS